MEDQLTCVGFTVCSNTELVGQATILLQQAHSMSSDGPESSGVCLCLSRQSVFDSYTLPSASVNYL